MRYSLAPPLVLEAAYLVASAPVDLPVILPSLTAIGACCLVLAWTFFHLAFTVSFHRPLVERLILRCTTGLRFALGLLIFDSLVLPTLVGIRVSIVL